MAKAPSQRCTSAASGAGAGGQGFKKTENSKDAMYNALSEASVAEQVAGHPHLVRLVDTDWDARARVPLLVFLYGGVSLKRSLRAMRPQSTFADSLDTHFEGLLRLHSLGLYHSDLQPENIFGPGTGRRRGASSHR